MKRQEQKIEDVLRIEGVGAKGYGILPKAAMQDDDLGPWAKLLYAYLCSLAGSGSQTWPQRNTILSHLGIGKNTYYAAQRELLDEGYLRVEQSRQEQRYGSNIYTLVTLPDKYKRPRKYNRRKTAEMCDRVIASGLMAGGYGMIPRLVLQDNRLWAKSKLVYSYIASFAGAGKSAFPSVEIATRQLRLNTRAWQRALRELDSYGLVTVVQRRVHGQFQSCDYILEDCPVARCFGQPAQNARNGGSTHISPQVKKGDTGRTSPQVKKRDTGHTLPEAKKRDRRGTGGTPPQVKKGDTGSTSPQVILRDTQKRDTKKGDTATSNNLLTALSSNSSIYPSPAAASKQAPTQQRLTALKERLQIADADVIYGPDAEMVRGIWSLLEDVLRQPGDTVALSRSVSVPKDKFWALDGELLTYVVTAVRRQTTPIRNLRSYLLTALYHADETVAAFYGAEINRYLDGKGG